MDGWHLRHPLEPGIPLAAVRGMVPGSAAVIDWVLAGLETGGVIEVDGALARRRGWAPRLAGEHARVAAEVLSTLRDSGAEPPSVSELEIRLGPVVEPVLRFLERGGDIVAVSEDRFYARGAVERLTNVLRRNMVPGRAYTPAELRDLLGFSRKYLIPFLEYCDRLGVTLRKDSGRVRAGT